MNAPTQSAVRNPVFVYGTLMPGQPGHRTIETIVTAKERGTLHKHHLHARDGLPYASPCTLEVCLSDCDATVSGFLLEGPGLVDQIGSFEPSTYRKATDELVERSDGSQTKATVFLQKGASKQRCRSIPSGWWSAFDDPLMRDGVEPVLQMAREALDGFQELEPESDADSYWRELWKLQGVYLCLWTVIERIAIYRYGGGRTGIASRISKLDTDEMTRDHLREKFGKLRAVTVFDVMSTENSELSTHGDKPFEALYQVRSNMVHQGKTPDGPPRDLALIRDSISALLEVMPLIRA